MLGRLDTPANHRRLFWICLIGIVSGTLAGIVVPAGSGWDFANFYDTGRRVAAGQVGSIYDSASRIGGEAPQGSMQFWGTPLSAYLYAPMAVLRPGAALVAFKIETALALFLALGFLFLWIARFREQPDGSLMRFAAVFVFLALLYQPFWTVFRVGGQTTPTAFLLLCGALLAHCRGRFLISWLLFGMAVLIKPFLIVGLAFLALSSGWKAFRTAVLVAVLFGVVSLLAVGWDLHARFVSRMLTGPDELKDWWFNSSLTLPFHYLGTLIGGGESDGVSETLSVALRLAAVGAVLLIGLRIVTRARRLPTDARLHLTFIVAVTVGVLASPIVWEHYVAFLFPLFAFIVAARHELGPGPLKLALAAVILCLGQNLVLALALADLVGREGTAVNLVASILKSSPCWLAAWILWRYPEELQDTHARLADRIRLPLWHEVRAHREAPGLTGQASAGGGVL
jgi:hypothetical protein